MTRRRAVTIATPADLHDLQSLHDHRVHRCRGHKAATRPNWDVAPNDVDSTPSSRASTPAPPPAPPTGGELTIAFHTTESGVTVPPAFYPGQSIPTVLSFTLPPGASLPLSLNPSLTLSLIGRQSNGTESRVIIDISVSLAEGLALWARDAGATAGAGEDVAATALPAGNYTLPLSAQVPSSPRLPPTFEVPVASFSLTYALCVALTCDVPTPTPLSASRKQRALVASAAAGFELLPLTLPSPPPRILPHSFWVPAPSPATGNPTERWVLNAALPTATYSPTSVIPLELSVHPPQEPFEREEKRVLAALEQSRDSPSQVTEDPESNEDGDGDGNEDDEAAGAEPSGCWQGSSCSPSPTGADSTCATASTAFAHLVRPRADAETDTAIVVRAALVREERIGEELTDTTTIVTRIGWMPLRRRTPVTLFASLPLMVSSGGWEHGFTTVLALDPTRPEAGVSVSSTFVLRIDVLFLSTAGLLDVTGAVALRPAIFDLLPSLQHSPGFSPPLAGAYPDALWAQIERLAPAVPRSLQVPLVIGSVSEPRDALYTHRWTDLSLDANGDVAVLVEGEDLSSENGWLVPPPSYACAIQHAPYVY